MASSWVRAQDIQDTRAKNERPGHRRTKDGVATCVDDTQMQTNKEARRQGGETKNQEIPPTNVMKMFSPIFMAKLAGTGQKAGQDQDMLFVEQDLLWEAS
ncbi:GD13107 [Drosophila simulans]|uniref:GD13107 n=1 Tax=Drosophila simulans TaxID=7240 RepID=B4QJU2_DROSI|nr:GD13107 [Drosophila simulans]